MAIQKLTNYNNTLTKLKNLETNMVISNSASGSSGNLSLLSLEDKNHRKELGNDWFTI
ncbi:hypothetical protein SFC08_00050 [Lysinibacillus halotolerans]|jgi:hypothetical protein|uniref:hypothetical protein n=1 Tax=Ureibacillus sp. FSL E2-3493 TaxID=2921367 RepID=UPI0031191461